MNAKTTVVLLSLFSLILMACGASRQEGYLSGPEAAAAEAKKAAATQPSSQPTSQPADPAAALWTQAETAWAKRQDPAMLRAALALYKQVIAADPKRRAALSRLSRGYYLLAYGHLTADVEILAAYDEGARWGERILGLRPEFRQRIAAGTRDYEALDVATKEDVPGIYWSYGNLGKWSVKQGFTTVLKNKSKLKAFITRVAALDENYYHGAGHRGLAAFYSKAPSFAGGDLKKAKHHFDRSLALAPNYFGTKVLMARYYAVKKQDKELFKKLLDEVIAGDPKSLPDVLPMQLIEQRKAKELLAQIDDKFE